MASKRKNKNSQLAKLLNKRNAIIGGCAALVIGSAIYAFSGDESPQSTPAEKLIRVDDVLARSEARANNNQTHTSNSMFSSYEAAVSEIKKTLETKHGQERYHDLVAGYKNLAAMLEKPLPPKVRANMLSPFHQISDELFFSSIRNEFSTEYIVRPGDSIGKIAKKHSVTEELLCDWNNVDWDRRSKIRVGDSFKIVKGKARLKVDKSDFCLSFYFGDNLVRQFIIAHGKGNNTPEGEAKVNGKSLHPDKAPFAGKMQREMSERWIGFTNFGRRTGIGIHGTKYEDSIPGETSHGCIRMYSVDVVGLYRWVPYGTKIEIKA